MPRAFADPHFRRAQSLEILRSAAATTATLVLMHVAGSNSTRFGFSSTLLAANVQPARPDAFENPLRQVVRIGRRFYDRHGGRCRVRRGGFAFRLRDRHSRPADSAPRREENLGA